jgi:hypothetical protein
LSGFSSHNDRNFPQICLVLTLRADFYGAALRHRPLADALQGHVENLGPMSRDVLAGLAPRLNARGNWHFTHFRVGNEPDKNPFRAVARALVPLFSAGRGQMPPFAEIDTLAGNLEKGRDAGGVTLPNVLGECRMRNPSRRILVIADQFEEVFTFIEDGALRQRFIDMRVA